jgi:hypothetical protein
MICITFDTDWMTEEGLATFLDRFPIPGIATFFAHQRYECLVGSPHEVGPHPFISNLDDWRPGLKTLAGSLGRPSRGTRTHSCVFSHMVGVGLAEDGYEYISQANNLFEDGVRPIRHPWGVWELPIYYMDNMDFWMPRNWPQIGHVPFNNQLIQRAIEGDALYVFDFHPLHIAMNSRSPDDYQEVKGRVIQGGVSPFDVAFEGRGSRVFFEELCETMRKHDIESFSCAEALDSWLARDAERSVIASSYLLEAAR